jgi:hypothetical protein
VEADSSRSAADVWAEISDFGNTDWIAGWEKGATTASDGNNVGTVRSGMLTDPAAPIAEVGRPFSHLLSPLFFYLLSSFSSSIIIISCPKKLLGIDQGNMVLKYQVGATWPNSRFFCSSLDFGPFSC